MNRWKIATLGAGAWVLAGCTAYMPLQHDHDKVDPAQPIVLMTVTMGSDQAAMVPKMIKVKLTGGDGQSIEVPVDNKAREEDPKLPDNTYYVRLALKPGTYQLDHLYAQAQLSLYLKLYYAHVLQSFTVPRTGVVYLGNINAHVRDWRPGDVAAGPMPNFATAANAGEVMGRFDVKITDRSATDLPAFRQRFAALKSVSIDKAILPPYDLAKVKRFTGVSTSDAPPQAAPQQAAPAKAAPRAPAKRR